MSRATILSVSGLCRPFRHSGQPSCGGGRAVAGAYAAQPESRGTGARHRSALAAHHAARRPFCKTGLAAK